MTPCAIGTADTIRPGGERWMVEEASAAAGAVVAGRTVYDHTHGWVQTRRSRWTVFVPTHRPPEVRVAGRPPGT